MEKIKTSKDAVKVLREIADFLETRPEFELDYYSPEYFAFYDKNKFVAAAKAIGDATKSVDEGEYAQFILTSNSAPVRIQIARDKVCRKTIQYDCEPLFSPEEIESL